MSNGTQPGFSPWQAALLAAGGNILANNRPGVSPGAAIGSGISGFGSTLLQAQNIQSNNQFRDALMQYRKQQAEREQALAEQERAQREAYEQRISSGEALQGLSEEQRSKLGPLIAAGDYGAVRDVLKSYATREPKTPTPFGAFLSDDPKLKAAAERYRSMGTPRTNVTVSPSFPRPATEKKADEAYGTKIGGMLGDLAVKSPRAMVDTQKIKSAENLLDDLEKEGFLGAYGPSKAQFSKYAPAAARAFGLNPESVADYETFAATVNQSILQYIGSEQGGIPASGFSDRDMAIVQSMAVSPSDEPAALRAKLAIWRHAKEAEQDLARHVGVARSQGKSAEAALYEWQREYKGQDRISNDPAVKALTGPAPQEGGDRREELRRKYNLE